MGLEHFEELSEKARAALSAGNTTQARQLYTLALAEQYESPDAHYGLATAFFLLGELANAAMHFKEVTRLDPLRAGAYINLGAVYNRLDKLDEALKALRRGIQLDNRRAEAYYNLGLVYRRQAQAELAIQAYREATHLNPRMADAHYNLANLLYEMGRYSQAVMHYKQSLDILPQFEKARSGLRQAEAALDAAGGSGVLSSSRSGILVKGATPPEPSAGPGAEAGLNRILDPLADGAVLSALHKGTIDTETVGRSYLKHVEFEVEPSIKELSATLLYPEKKAHELKGRITKFDAAIQNLQSFQRELQSQLKRLREVGERLLTPQEAGQKGD